MQIDHNEHEGRKYPDWHKHLRPDSEYARRAKKDEMRYSYPVGFIMLALLWVWLFVYETPHWVSLALGFGTGMMVMAWAADKFGNKPYKDLFSGDDKPD